ncbi:MAG: superoxide dismutase [Salinivirgaceae bacterium]|nr:superoxide dismutase [Salinivirgaceae bacterium]
MIHELPALPYAINALEPHISQKTLEFHHGKHHQAYVTNLNNLIKGTDFENMSLIDIIKKSSGGIFNNAAQVWNHTFYFEQFSAKAETSPTGDLEKMIVKNFGSVDQFKTEFEKAGATLFGSGWAWLVKTADGKLEIMQTSNAETPIRQDIKGLMVVDVWEHAYYLDTQNARPKYISNFWNVLDWKKIAERL